MRDGSLLPELAGYERGEGVRVAVLPRQRQGGSGQQGRVEDGRQARRCFDKEGEAAGVGVGGQGAGAGQGGRGRAQAGAAAAHSGREGDIRDC